MAAIDAILHALLDVKGSDLHLKGKRPPLFRVSGDLMPIDAQELSAEDIHSLVSEITTPEQQALLETHRELDMSYELGDRARFRVNLFYQSSMPGAVFRAIPIKVPTIEDLGLPVSLKEITQRPQGVIMVTGPTGCGKSTTLAALLEHINRTRPVHVVTVEDPIEFVYEDKVALINQRQLVQDVKSFTMALKRVLRQDPDVILMGEMRDRESIEFGIHAAETGHLVFSTLHTNDAKQTIDRIIDSYAGEDQVQIRKMLALTLCGVISQRLVKRADGNGLVAALEILVNSPNVKQLIEEGKSGMIEKAMTTSKEYYGMQTFNMHLTELVNTGIISVDTALGTTSNPGDLQLLLRGIGGGGGRTEAQRSADQMASNAAPPKESEGGAAGGAKSPPPIARPKRATSGS